RNRPERRVARPRSALLSAVRGPAPQRAGTGSLPARTAPLSGGNEAGQDRDLPGQAALDAFDERRQTLETCHPPVLRLMAAGLLTGPSPAAGPGRRRGRSAGGSSDR